MSLSRPQLSRNWHEMVGLDSKCGALFRVASLHSCFTLCLVIVLCHGFCLFDPNTILFSKKNLHPGTVFKIDGSTRMRNGMRNGRSMPTGIACTQLGGKSEVVWICGLNLGSDRNCGTINEPAPGASWVQVILIEKGNVQCHSFNKHMASMDGHQKLSKKLVQRECVKWT